MNENVKVVFGLIGGLALFLYGMNSMSDALQKAAGEKMKKILEFLTKNPIMGALAGALVTAVLQSSSATTVMVIGFVSAGLMSLPQAISVIFGANIGTTMTAQLMAFKISDYIYPLIFIGFMLNFLGKKEKVKNIGMVIFSFGLLFEGIEIMGSVMKPLAGSPIFVDLMGKVSSVPVLGVVLGAVMTLVVQSSSATIAVLQSFASQAGSDGVSSVMGLSGAIPILLGDNIGTTITALLASIGQTKDAKRTAVAHCIFNISGCFLFIWFVKPYAALIQYISPKGPEIAVISRQIANAHTLFNITMTVIWVPLIWLMVKIVMKIIPDGQKKVYSNAEPQFLDSKLVSQPTAALQLVVKEVARCIELVSDNLKELIAVSTESDSEKIKAVIQNSEDTRKLYERITEYLSELFASGGLTEEQANQTAGIMYILSDVDRMSALCREVCLSLKDKEEKKYKYSKDAMRDMRHSLQLIQEMFTKAVQMMATGNTEAAKDILQQKEKILDLGIKMRKSHVERVGEGKCKAKLTEPYNRIIHHIDRMGNCCINIVDAVQGKAGQTYLETVA